MYSNILVPLDGSDTSRRGLTEAIGLATELKAQLRLLHVTSDFPIMLEMASTIDFENTGAACTSSVATCSRRPRPRRNGTAMAGLGRVAELKGGRVATRSSRGPRVPMRPDRHRHSWPARFQSRADGKRRRTGDARKSGSRPAGPRAQRRRVERPHHGGQKSRPVGRPRRVGCARARPAPSRFQSCRVAAAARSSAAAEGGDDQNTGSVSSQGQVATVSSQP